MNIGIIVHSQTGNTYSVGKNLKDTLKSSGHKVDLVRIKTLSTTKGDVKSSDIQLDVLPDISEYDVLIFGAWIKAFSLCPDFAVYLNQLNGLEGREVSCFVTQHFPYKWMGGTNGLATMKKILVSKGATISETGVVNWSRNDQRAIQIESLIESINTYYKRTKI